MKAKYIFLVVVIAVLCMGKANARIMPAIQKTELLKKDKSALNEHLSEYVTFTMDKRALIDSLHKNGRCQFQIHIDEQRNWTFDLQLNDMRAPDYRQTYISDKGTFEYEPYIVNTFKGKTSNNQIARFTIDKDNFFGIILDGKDYYVIRPAKDYTQNISDESLIVYKSSDIISENENANYINDVLELSEDGMEQDMPMRGNTPCNYYLKIATDADYEFFYDKMGSNLAATYSYIFSIMNLIEGVYENTFNMTFIVTYQNVWTTTSNGYPYTATYYSTLLSQLRNYWNSNMTGISRNIAHLFTGKLIVDVDGNLVGGVAYLGQISNPNVPITNTTGYSITRHRGPEMYQTTAHEIGHNLNGGEISQMKPIPPECLCNSNTASVMCQGEKAANLWFCQTSINQISPFLASKSTLLTGSFPANLTLSGTVSGFNVYQATQKITSNQVINSGYTVYKAAEVELDNDFEVKLGAEFEIIIDDNGCP